MTHQPPLSAHHKAIENAATAWFLQRDARACNPALEKQFQDWLQESPEHQREYQQLIQTWAALAALPRPTRLPKTTGKKFWPRCAVLASSISCAVAAYFFVPISYSSIHNSDKVARHIELTDGSQLHVNVGTKVVIRYTLASRHIHLQEGEIFIDAAADRRPLQVIAADASLRDIGTEFNVVLLPETLEVAVRSGQVKVSFDQFALSTQPLNAGDSALFSRHDAKLLQHHKLAPAEIGAWQDGLIVAHEMGLPQLAAYLSLYRQAPIHVADTRARGLKVSGTLDLRQPEALLAMLPTLLPVRLVHQASGKVLISSE